MEIKASDALRESQSQNTRTARQEKVDQERVESRDSESLRRAENQDQSGGINVTA